MDLSKKIENQDNSTNQSASIKIYLHSPKRNTISRKHRANPAILSAVSKKRAAALIFSRSLRVFIVLASDK